MRLLAKRAPWGMKIENQRDAKGRDAGFEIRGVPQDLLAKFSQRSRQRDEAIAVFVEQQGRKPTDNEIAVLVRESRADKLAEISTQELREKQRARLTPDEKKALVRARSMQAPTLSVASSSSSLDYAKDHIFERVSVAQDHELLTDKVDRKRHV